MKIAFSKVYNLDIPVEYRAQGVECLGTLSQKAKELVKLEGILKADLVVSCDRCGADVKFGYNEPLKIQISNGAYSNSNDDLDIIESFDGTIDMDEIVESELNMIKSDYYYCEQCQ